MSDTYLTLHNIELSETEFAVNRIIDNSLQNSPSCVLPDDNPVSLSLPPLDTTLPPLECEYRLNTPLVPLPYFDFCTPQFENNITFTGCAGTLVTGDVTLTGGPCNFSLNGDIDICTEVACPDGFLFEVNIDVEKIGSSPYTDLTSTLAVSNGPCGATLSGAITLEDNTPNLDGVCLEGFTVDIVDITASEQSVDLGDGVELLLTTELLVEDTNTEVCNSTKSINLIISGSLSGASWQEVEFCEDGVPVTKKILVAA